MSDARPKRLGILRQGEDDALLLAVPPLLVAFLSQVLFEVTGYDIVPLGHELAEGLRGVTMPDLPAQLSEHETRVLWTLAVFLNLASAVALTAVAVLILQRSVSLRGLRLFVPVGLLLVVGGLASLLYYAYAETPISGLYSFTYDSLEASGLFGAGFLFAVKFLVVLLNMLTIVAPMTAMMAACSTLAPPRDGGPGDVAFLGGQVRFLKALVVLGSVYMVAGVLHLGVWLSWPAILVQGPDLAGQVQSFAKAMSIYWGGTSTVLIASFYVPALIVLRRRAEAALERSEALRGTLTPEQFLESHGLSLSMTKQLPQIAAVLAPLFAGPIGSAVAELSGAVTLPG